MFNFLTPTNIYLILSKIQKFIRSIFFPILIVGLVFSLILSPSDRIQGDAMRIMYVHVPSAWLGLACFATIALLSLLSFIFRIKKFFLITNRFTFYLSCYCNRSTLGRTYLGNMVGLGRKTDFNDFFNVFLYFLYFVF